MFVPISEFRSTTFITTGFPRASSHGTIINRETCRNESFTLGELLKRMWWLLLIPLAFVLVVAFVFTLKFLSDSRSPFSVVGTAMLSVPLMPFWALMWLTSPLWMYSRCPSCNARKLVTYSLRSNPPSPNFYKCDACDARFMFVDGQLSDASSSEYDNRFLIY